MEWIKLYKNWEYKSWELEILSRRVSAWITNFDFLLAEKDKEFSKILIHNLFKQIKHLRKQANSRYFNALEKAIARGDNSWGTAVDIAVNLYLDIINLFLDLLEILAASD